MTIKRVLCLPPFRYHFFLSYKIHLFLNARFPFGSLTNSRVWFFCSEFISSCIACIYLSLSTWVCASWKLSGSPSSKMYFDSWYLVYGIRPRSHRTCGSLVSGGAPSFVWCDGPTTSGEEDCDPDQYPLPHPPILLLAFPHAHQHYLRWIVLVLDLDLLFSLSDRNLNANAGLSRFIYWCSYLEYMFTSLIDLVFVFVYGCFTSNFHCFMSFHNSYTLRLNEHIRNNYFMKYLVYACVLILQINFKWNLLDWTYSTSLLTKIHCSSCFGMLLISLSAVQL